MVSLVIITILRALVLSADEMPKNNFYTRFYTDISLHSRINCYFLFVASISLKVLFQIFQSPSSFLACKYIQGRYIRMRHDSLRYKGTATLLID